MAKTKKTKKIEKTNLLIRTYGLFWKKDDVFWGKPGKPAGNLLGIKHGAKKSDAVNFREQIGIYVLYADYKIIYIGQAGNGYKNLFDRLKGHLSDDLSGRWNQFSWYGLKWVKNTKELSTNTNAAHPKTSVLLNHIEAILIHASEPPLNRQGGRWGKGVQRFLQHRDEDNLGKSQNDLLKEIHENSLIPIKTYTPPGNNRTAKR